MFKFKSLTNVRPTKDLGSQIIAAPTEGQFKVTPDAAKILGVSDGEYLQLIVAEDGEGATTYFAVKGEEGRGGKVAASNKGGGGTFTFSASAAWGEMDGSANHNTHFDVADEALDAEALVGSPFEGMALYPLTFVEAVEKQSRKKKEEGKEEEVVKEDITTEEVADDSTQSFDDI